MSVFVGTTNEDNYLRDNTGGRRFWPIKCGDINVGLIAENREQYFAEAVHLFKEGAKWWVMPEGQTAEVQEVRRRQDEWEPVIGKWLAEHPTYSEFLLADLAKDALELEKSKLDLSVQHRIGSALRSLGLEKKQKHMGGKVFKVWVRSEGNPQLQGSSAEPGLP